MRPPARALVVALVVVSVAVCGACEISPPPSPRTGIEGAITFDPCTLLTADEAGAAIGAAVTPRMLMSTTTTGPECWFEAGMHRREEVLLIPWTPPVPDPPASTPEELIPGIGKAARWSVTQRHGTLHVWVSTGAAFTVEVKSPAKDDGALRQAAVDVATKVAPRLESPEPAQSSALPAPEPAPFDVCQLLPIVDQVRVLGWTPGTPPHGTPLEFVGGVGRGSWECSRYGSHAVLLVAVTKEPVAEQELAAQGKPLDELPRKSFFVDIPPLDASEFQGAAVLSVAPDARMLSIVLFDRTSTQKRRAALVELARVVLAGLS